jgi:hypothetical protein
LKTPESAVLRACKDYLALRGHFVVRVNGGGFKTERGGWVRCSDTPGTPDLMGCAKDGRALAVECKSAKGRLSADQREFGEAWQERGGIYVVARGIVDLEEIGL